MVLLLVEDVPEDIELMLLSLNNSHLEFTHDVAETATIYQEKLQKNSYDAVLADYHLSGFNGLEALEILRESGQKIPFILVTGSLGEEAAVECIKAGITDYLLKDRLFRLPSILQRSLEEFSLRRQQQTTLLEQQKAEKALRESEQRFRALIENAIDIILIVCRDGKLTYLSPSVQRILGHSPESLKNRCFFELIHPDDQQRIKEIFDTIKTTANQSTSLPEFRVYHHDKHWVMLDAIAKNLEEDSSVAGFVINCHDVTERHNTAQQLRYDAYHDKLTGLANRSGLLQQLQQAIAQDQRRRQDHFAVLFLDLDRFKVINDSLGHLMGDKLLQQTAHRLQQCHRERDLLARLGGDEFVFLLRDIQELKQAVVVAQRIHQVFEAPFILDNRELFISASIGITISADHYKHPEQVLRDADTAMYAAKAKGKGCHEIFAQTMYLSALRELHLQSDLKQAIQRQELVVYYQPIFCLKTQKMVGVEALVRWHPPGEDLIPPDDFIPIAEETGLIIDIDRWVLKNACQQLYQWQQEFQEFAPEFVSVNLSPKQFSDPHLKDEIVDIISTAGISREYLKLEITETVFLKNSRDISHILSQFQQLNIQICLDDFGTGYSSLSSLSGFPLNSLKVDRSFVSHLGDESRNNDIVRIVGRLAQELELELIAEGIEEDYQIEKLQSLGYTWGQGYYFCPPVDHQSLRLLLEKNKNQVAEE